MTLREIVHAHIPTLRPTSTVRDAVDKMDIYQFPALVITNDDMEVKAVVTEGDLCRALGRAGGIMKLSHETLLTMATPNPTVAHPEMEVSDALHLMLTTGITLLPVTEHGRLIGVVLRTDLMQAMLMDSVARTSDSSPS